MSNKGLLGAYVTPDANFKAVYTAPQNTWASVSVSICNPTAGTVTVSLGLVNAYLESACPLTAHNAMERTGIIVGAGQSLMFASNTVGVHCAVYGIEESE